MSNEQNSAGFRGKDLLIGKMVGNYRIEERIGLGAMGTVYRGVHPRIGKSVAVKVLAIHLTDQEEMVSRFKLEAYALNKINHPNIIEVFDFGMIDDGRWYYSMEFLSGITLSQKINNSILELGETVNIFKQICDALDEVHERGIIHRDLKPGNIFLVGGKQKPFVKILDFGIAKVLDDKDSSGVSTNTGTVLGTPLYMSPEQAMGKNSDLTPASDTYSLGVILYKIFSNDLPVKGAGIGEIVGAHLLQTPVELKTANPQIPDSLNFVVMKSLAKKVEDRYQSAGALFQDLEIAVKNLEPSSVLNPRHALYSNASGISNKISSIPVVRRDEDDPGYGNTVSLSPSVLKTESTKMEEPGETKNIILSQNNSKVTLNQISENPEELPESLKESSFKNINQHDVQLFQPKKKYYIAITVIILLLSSAIFLFFLLKIKKEPVLSIVSFQFEEFKTINLVTPVNDKNTLKTGTIGRTIKITSTPDKLSAKLIYLDKVINIITPFETTINEGTEIDITSSQNRFEPFHQKYLIKNNETIHINLKKKATTGKLKVKNSNKRKQVNETDSKGFGDELLQ